MYGNVDGAASRLNALGIVMLELRPVFSCSLLNCHHSNTFDSSQVKGHWNNSQSCKRQFCLLHIILIGDLPVDDRLTIAAEVDC